MKKNKIVLAPPHGGFFYWRMANAGKYMTQEYAP